MFKHRRLTLSVEATEVRMLVVQEQHILHWASVPLPAGTMHSGQVVQPKAFGQTVSQITEELGRPRHKSVVSLSGQGAVVRILDMPPVPSQMRDEAVHREARREFPLPLEELYFSWQAISNSDSPRLRVFTLGVPREAVDNCVVGLRSAGVPPVAMGLKPLALVRAVNRSDVLLVDVEEETESVTLVHRFVPYVVHSIAVPEEVAESPAERAYHLAAEIRRTLDFYATKMASEQPPWSPVVCLTGALGDDEEIQGHIGVHWTLVEPDPPLPVPEDLPLLPYLVNIGLALKRVP